ncbi:tetratricopeptide repeat protein [Marinicellulosiphila megalodicopiae]|uniref:tetratricopeptide repeat protein n=1 Tax=Marinicellulosiphila megalodicopiae TaxID=2724896 RepID=UPI003BAE54ED
MSILLDALKNAALEKKKRDALLSVNEPGAQNKNEVDDSISDEESINSFLSEQESISKQNNNKNKLEKLRHSDLIKDQFLSHMGAHKTPTLPDDITDQDFESPSPIKTASASAVINENLVKSDIEPKQEMLDVKQELETDISTVCELQLEKEDLDLDDQLELNEEFSIFLDNKNNEIEATPDDINHDVTFDQSNIDDTHNEIKSISIEAHNEPLDSNQSTSTIEIHTESTGDLTEKETQTPQIVKAPLQDIQENITDQEIIQPEIDEVPVMPTNDDVRNERKQQSIRDQENQTIAFIDLKKKNLNKTRNNKIQLIAMYSLGIIGLVTFTGYQYYINNSIEVDTPVIVVSDAVQSTTKNLLNSNGVETSTIQPELNNTYIEQSTNIKDGPNTLKSNTNTEVLDLPIKSSQIDPVTAKPVAVVNTVKKTVIENNPATVKVKKTIKATPVITAQPIQTKALSIKQETISPYQDAIYTAYQFYQLGNFENAKQHYLNALSIEPTSSDAQFGLAGIAMAQQNYSMAIEYYQQRINIQPNDALALSGMILAASKFENINKLKSQLNEILFQNPKASHLHFIQGTLHARQQNWVDAQQAFFTAWQYSPDKAVYAYNLAISLEQLNLPKQALGFYKQAQSLDDQSKHFIDSVILTNRVTQLVKIYE